MNSSRLLTRGPTPFHYLWRMTKNIGRHRDARIGASGTQLIIIRRAAQTSLELSFSPREYSNSFNGKF